MKSLKTDTGYMLVFERGESLIPTIVDFCTEEQIQGGIFRGVGAVERVKIGYYDLPKKEYVFREEPGVFEVASMNGNIALVDGKPFLHAHAVLSRCDETMECIGAHIKEAFVAVTLEVFVTPLKSPLTREHDESIGLKLLKL